MSKAYEIAIAIQGQLDARFGKAMGEASKRLSELEQEAKKLNAAASKMDGLVSLRREVGQQQRAYYQAAQKVADLGRAISSAENPSRELTADFKRAKAELGRTKAALDRKTEALRLMDKEMGTAGVSLRNLTKREQEYRSAADKASQVQKAQSMRDARREKFRSGLVSAAPYMQEAGRKAMEVGSGVVSTGMGFEAQMSTVQAVSRASAKDMAILEAQAKDLGAKTRWSAMEAGQGMEYLAMAGFKTKDIYDAMPGVLDLATASGLELGRTSDIASDILSAFNMKAEKMGYLGDVLTNTFTSSNTNLEMLGETMKYVAPNAAKAGIGLEKTAAMAGLLAGEGIKASQAGTAMRMMISRMAKPPKEAAKALDKLGVKVQDTKGNMRDFPTILKEIQNAMDAKKMGNAKQLEILGSIFGVEASSAAAILTKHASQQIEVNGKLVDSITAYAETLKKTETTKKTAALMDENLAGRVKGLNSAFESLKIAIYDKIRPALMELTSKTTEFVRSVKEWVDNHPVLTKALAGIGGALAGISSAMIPMVAAFKMLSPVLQFLVGKSGFSALSGILGPFAAAGGPLLMAAAGFKALYDNSEDFRQIVDGIADGARKMASDIGDALGPVLKDVGTWISDVTEKFLRFLGLYDKVKGINDAASDFETRHGLDQSSMEGSAWDVVQGANVDAHMATGGIATGPTRALIGEGGEPEAVLPLSRLADLMPAARGGDGGMAVTFAPVINLSGAGQDAYAAVRRGLNAGADDLRRTLDELMTQRRRLAFD